MEDLSFGEQVKIMLRRKGMTIKELAETIEERTGKVMSRQNLTQRLNRDNFQEQDMRLIAAILECPFYLSIFPMERAVSDTQTMPIPTEEEIMKYANRAQSHKRADDTVVVQSHQSDDPVHRTSRTMSGEERLAAAADLQLSEEEKADVAKALEIMQGESAMAANERDMTIGEVYGIYQELEEEPEAAEEPESAEMSTAEDVQELNGQAVKQSAETDAEHVGDMDDGQEHISAGLKESEESETDMQQTGGSSAEDAKDSSKTEEKKEPRKDIFHTGAIFLRRLSGQDKKDKGETRRFAKITDEDLNKEEEKAPVRSVEPMKNSGVVRTSREPIPMDSDDFEPVLRYNDVEEDLERGEMNPYTGHEYQSNSVRMHPTRIGYVQVYDRSEHGWTDMTEWAFLGHQERLKVKLGKNYREPIYLD